MQDAKSDKPSSYMDGSNTTFQASLRENAYFQALPVYIQETIKQSGTEIQSEEQLRSIARGFLDDENPSNNYYD